jgi:hypothetical protein
MNEILAIPEEHLLEVISVVRAGLRQMSQAITPECRNQLIKWCQDEEDYLQYSSGE